MKKYFLALSLAVFATFFYSCVADGIDTIVLPDSEEMYLAMQSSSSAKKISSSSSILASSSSTQSSTSSSSSSFDLKQSSSSAKTPSPTPNPTPNPTPSPTPNPPTPPPTPTTYTIVIGISGNVTDDNVTVSPDKGVAGTNVTLSYTVVNTAHYNQLEFGGVNAPIASVESEGTGTRTYTINAADASNKVITITAVFTHTDLTIDHIAFSEDDKGHITKTYGDAVFTNAVTTAHQGTGAITYHSSNTAVATVNSSGQVTILSAGSAVISAEKAADGTYAHATTTYTLTVNPKPVTITGLSASNKTYDGTTTATVTGTAVINGKVGSDDVTAVAGTASFANAAVENNKTVTFSGWSLGGDKAGNYTLSAQPTSVTANITPNGSAEAPFLVTNEAELRKVGTGTDGWTLSAHYKQTANITLSGSFTRIGNSSTKFTGSYDGQNHTITGLNMSMANAVLGVFGWIGAGGTVKNMNVTGTITQTGNESTGGIAGGNDGTIDNCSFDGTITGSTSVSNELGGIVGKNTGTVINSRSTATVSGRNQVGGIAGVNIGKIDNSYNTGNISGNQIVGGIAGENNSSSGNIKNCYNTGNVTAANNTIGGIAGANSTGALVENCYNTGDVTSTAGNTVGGIVGSNAASTIRNCVSLGARVTGISNTGRVAGNSSGTLASNSGRADTDGVNGTATATNINGENISINSGASLTIIFKAANGWESSIWNISGNITIGANLPTLKPNTQSPAPTIPAAYNPPGTAANPFLVSNEAELRKVGTGTDGWTLSAYYKQTANIALTSSNNFIPIGSSSTPFTGTYDGDGKTITNLTVNRDNNYVGLFALIDVTGTVKNMTVTGTVTQNFTNSNVGGIAGVNEGRIENCSFSGTVTGGTTSNEVGGIAGQNKATGTIIYSRNRANVTGKTSVGGIAGQNNGTIEQSYNTGNITENNQQAGGIAGVNSGTGSIIKNCYNTGVITGLSFPGGIVGRNQTSAVVEYCYNIGTVTGTAGGGGISGSNATGGIIRYCGSFGTTVRTANSASIGRITAGSTGSTLTANKARSDMKVGITGSELLATTGVSANDIDGENVALGTSVQTVFASFDPNIWYIWAISMTVGGNLPTLRKNEQSPAPTLPAALP